jgi:AcrR family transcriptional regulator
MYRPDGAVRIETWAKHISDPRRHGDTRARILAAAEELSCTLGPARISLDAVAMKAGVSKGGLLYHFPTKHDLLRALVSDHVEGLRRALEAESPPGAPPVERARAYFRVVLALLAEPTAPQGLFAALAEDPEFIAPLREFRRAMLREVFGRCPDPDLARIAYFASEGALHSRLTDSQSQDAEARKRLFQSLDRMLLQMRERV